MLVSVTVILSSSAYAENYEGFEYTVNGEDITINGYTGSDTAIVIPASIEGKTVTAIAESAFEECTGFTSVTIPDSVESISASAFKDCTGITTLKMSCSANYANNSFEGCTNIATVTLTKGTGEGAMKDYKDESSNIDSYTNTPWNISSDKFKKLVLEDGVTTIGSYAFRGCSSLASVTVPDSVEKVKEYAFYNCSALKSVAFSDSLDTIGEYAFYGCSAMTSAAIGNTATKIGDYTFYKCSSLKSITLPETVTEIGKYAFFWCVGLKEFAVNKDNKKFASIDGNLVSKHKTILYKYPSAKTKADITLSRTVKTVKTDAIYPSYYIKSINFNNVMR